MHTKITRLLGMLACAGILLSGVAWGGEAPKKEPCCEPTVKDCLKCDHPCCKKAGEKGKVCKRCHSGAKKTGEEKKEEKK